MKFLSPDSYWHLTAGESAFSLPPASGEYQVDVVVIGAGITGLTAALHLKNAGKQVAVLEAGQVGCGTTGGTSAHLEIMPDQGLLELSQSFGEVAARDVLLVRSDAIDQIEDWVDLFQIECDFKRIPAYAYTEREDGVPDIKSEYEVAQLLGFPVALNASPGLPFQTMASLEIRDQARFHSLKYLHGLAKAFHGENDAIYENTQAKPPQDGNPCIVTTDNARFVAKDVIIATHSAYLGISQFDMRQAPYQSYVAAVRVKETIPDALFWDDEDPYHYLRLAHSGDPHLLLVGGADHKTGQAHEQEHTRKLIDYVSQRFTVEAVEQIWSSEFFEPSDGLPYIGRVPSRDHLYMATGFSGTGLTYGTAAGRILADLILDNPSPYAELFSPSRFNVLTSAKEFISENLNVVKHFIADRFSAESAESFSTVNPGEGCILKVNGDTFAAYRDEGGELHLMSPVCKHAGCFVQWNEEARTWDCPCHGGRYAATGERIYGPPTSDLEKKELPINT